MDFKNTIVIETPGMSCGTAYYSLEDVYQAFKERYEGEQMDSAIRLKKANRRLRKELSALENEKKRIIAERQAVAAGLDK